MSTQILYELLDNLSSNDDLTRESALRDASALPSSAKLNLFRMAARRYRRQHRRYASRNVIYIVLFLAFMIGGQFAPESWLGPLFSGMIVAFVCNGMANRSPERSRQQLVLLGQNIDDVRFVVPLLRLLYEPEAKRPDPVLAGVLMRLLPRLQYSDTKRWRPDDRKLLLLPLENRFNPELTLCMLKALEQVGDATAVPMVQQLAVMRLYDPRISQAARDCLPSLYEHVEQLRQAQTLLRPTDIVTDDHENLLRPTHHDADNESYEELLRPDSRNL